MNNIFKDLVTDIEQWHMWFMSLTPPNEIISLACYFYIKNSTDVFLKILIFKLLVSLSQYGQCFMHLMLKMKKKISII